MGAKRHLTENKLVDDVLKGRISVLEATLCPPEHIVGPLQVVSRRLIKCGGERGPQ